MRVSRKWYVADFETTLENYYNETGKTKVWLYAISDNEGNIVNHGTSLEEFMKYVYSKLRNKTVYFHNLKFDGQFILYYCFDNLKYDDKLEEDFTFRTTINDTGAWYSIEIRWTKSNKVQFLDSLKILPFSVRKIAEDFNLPMKKGSIDYSTYEITDETLEYVFNDVRIVALALKEVKAEGLTKMTMASSAYHDYSNRIPKEMFADWFPELPNEYLDEWRYAYRGGRTQVNRIYAEQEQHNVYRYDVNSMYPYIMYSKPMPVGMPHPCKEGTYPFEIMKIKVEFDLKDETIPSLLAKGSIWGVDNYYENTEGSIIIWITSLDLKLLKRNYIIYNLEILECYGFNVRYNIFKDYIDYWYGRKLQDKGAKKIVDKLMLNSLYGKFGTKLEIQDKIPVMDKSGELIYVLGEKHEGKKYYLPIALSITSWGHVIIDDAIHEVGFKNFIYCDTDSVHTLVPLSERFVDSSKLGAFKLEGFETDSKYIRQKTYIYKQGNEWDIKCAGLTEQLKQNYLQEHKGRELQDFKTGLVMDGKLMQKRVKGGVILYETTFEIKG